MVETKKIDKYLFCELVYFISKVIQSEFVFRNWIKIMINFNSQSVVLILIYM
jgi:hypothetical protein